MDRVVLKPGIRRRLDESVSTAVGLSEGTMLVQFPDSGEEVLFSESAACHSCGISVQELSTQLFSFNNPQGACPECSGLGVKQVFAEQLIVPDPTLSLEEGAIAPWSRRKLATHNAQWIQALASHYGFDPVTPFNSSPTRSSRPYSTVPAISVSNFVTAGEAVAWFPRFPLRASFPAWIVSFGRPVPPGCGRRPPVL